ncbi:enoyl-CoA hydratase/isomerase family protein [Acidianus brierleyi]|uniref:Enoyl-CoA hydratase/isomerase family protein n=1 Tax=Acidianus brierleyi TaxID=41673 RepID=A0A2U9II19_9CREN|nr:enoyl-CoA hydratase/isomerase family protein [Acidianus brierleyi]AWR95692.1 enoyl-CoA hydratase/isomerase family protein [Acidianus brierleyi]
METKYSDGKILLKKDGKIAEVILNRPEKLNTITLQMRRDLGKIFEDLDKDPETSVIIVRGEGDKAFSSGGDISEFLNTSPEDLLDWGKTIETIENVSKPTIAVLKGYILGAGTELALACDIRVASPETEIGLPEIRLGMIPASGGLTKMVKSLGPLKAKYYLLLGKRIKAQEAQQLGLIHEIAENPYDRALEISKDLISLSPLAIKAMKSAINLIMDSPIQVGYDIERKTFGLLRFSEDFKEGIDAFLQKRKPQFNGK